MEEAELCFPQMLNLSCLKPRADQGQKLLHSLVLSCMSALITGLNLLVILSISCFRKLQSPTHRILLSLAVSDLLLGLVLMPITIQTTDVCWVWGEAACVLYFYLATTLTQASVGSMVLISLDRYIAVVDPLHYQTRMARCRVDLCICLSWTCAVLSCFLILNDVFDLEKQVHCIGECYVISLFEVDILLSWVIPLVIILVFYIRIFIVVLRKVKANNNSSTSQVMQGSEFKAARNLGSVIATYIVCYTPFYSTVYAGDKIEISGETYLASVLMLCLNSVVNPLLYVLIYPSFRKAFRAILTLKILGSEPVVL